MDSNTLLHLFEPFFTTKSAGKGAGLGLATVFGIVKQSGGEIEVDSALGRGTTFRVFLPLAKDAVEGAVPRTTDERPVDGSETVVVVEHEAPLRHALVRALRERGYHVIAEPTGQSTLDACRTFGGEIHLLVTDVVLPALSGPEIARRLRERHPGLRVLFVSGYGNAAGYPEFPVGGRWFLEKPFTPWALAARVREALDAD
jgi:two-component system, cell cycle sensor histidine kinase and response regulator CckA